MRLTLLFLLAATTVNAAPPATPKVAATVNGEPVPEGAVTAELRRLEAMTGPLNGTQATLLRQEILEELIDDALLRQYLRVEVPNLAADELDKHWQGFLASLERQKTTLKQHLERTGRTEAELRAYYRVQLQFDLFLDPLATEDRLKTYFHDHPEQFDGRKVRLHLIMFRHPVTASPGERALSVGRAGAIRDEILVGRRTFAEAAKVYSVDATASKGGDAGEVAVFDALLDPALTKVAHQLAVNEISRPVETPGAVTLLTVTERLPGKLPDFAAAQDLVRERFAEEVRQNLLQKLRAAATVTRPEATEGR